MHFSRQIWNELFRHCYPDESDMSRLRSFVSHNPGDDREDQATYALSLDVAVRGEAKAGGAGLPRSKKKPGGNVPAGL